jgi:hypothetical protein
VSVFAEGPSLLRLAVGKGKFAKQQYGLTTLDDVIKSLKALPREISLKYYARRRSPARRRCGNRRPPSGK